MCARAQQEGGARERIYRERKYTARLQGSRRRRQGMHAVVCVGVCARVCVRVCACVCVCGCEMSCSVCARALVRWVGLLR